MNKLFLILLFTPAYSFAQNDYSKSICNLGVGGRSYYIFSIKLKQKISYYIDHKYDYLKNNSEIIVKNLSFERINALKNISERTYILKSIFKHQNKSLSKVFH